MSIQGKIDYHLSKEGGYQFNMVITGESGDAIIPEGVNISFYDCQIGKLVAPKNNAIFLGGATGCIVKGDFDMSDGSLIAENSQFIGEVFWRKGTRVKMVKDSKFMFRVTAEDSTYADLYNVAWDGFGSWAIRALKKSRVTITNGDIQKRTKGAWAEKGSTIDLTDCIIATITGITAEDDSFVNMLQGELKAIKVGAEIKKRSQVYLSALSSPVEGTEYHVKMENYSKLVAHNTAFKQTPKTSIHAKNRCRIEVMDSDMIKSLGDHCIDISDNTTAHFVKVGTIESLGAVAIKLKEKSTVTCLDVDTIQSMASDAVRVLDNSSKFEATTKGGSVIKGMLSGIVGNNNVTVSVDNYSLVQGLGAHAVVLDNEANCYFSKTQMIKSLGGNGVMMSNESGLTLQDHQALESAAGSGIVADNNCSVQLQRVQSVVGKAGDGIKISNNTNLDIIYTQLIDGQVGLGINADQNCDVRYSRSTKITGMVGGIKNVGNGSLDVELVKEIVPKSGFGISTEDQVDTRLVLVKKIEFGTTHTDCDVVMKDCTSIKNQTGAAITMSGGEVEIKNVAASGTGASVSLSKTSARASNTKLDQSIVSTQSTVELKGVTLNGSITSAQDVINIYRGVMNGTIDAAASNINLEIAQINGLIAMAGGSLDADAANVSGSIALANAHMKSHLSNCPSVELVGSSLVAQGGALGVITVDPSSSAIVLACASTFAGAGNAISMSSGELLPAMNGISMIGSILRIQDNATDFIQLADGTIVTTSTGVTNITAGGVITITAPSVAIV